MICVQTRCNHNIHSLELESKATESTPALGDTNYNIIAKGEKYKP